MSERSPAPAGVCGVTGVLLSDGPLFRPGVAGGKEAQAARVSGEARSMQYPLTAHPAFPGAWLLPEPVKALSLSEDRLPGGLPEAFWTLCTSEAP